MPFKTMKENLDLDVVISAQLSWSLKKNAIFKLNAIMIRGK